MNWLIYDALYFLRVNLQSCFNELISSVYRLFVVEKKNKCLY